MFVMIYAMIANYIGLGILPSETLTFVSSFTDVLETMILEVPITFVFVYLVAKIIKERRLLNKA